MIKLNERSMEFAFTLPNGKTIVLYGVSSGTKIFDFYGQTRPKQLYSLVYVCLDKNGAVEFTFTGTPKNPFWYSFIKDENKQTLTDKGGCIFGGGNCIYGGNLGNVSEGYVNVFSE